MSLNSLLSECANRLLETGRPTVDDVVACALEHDPETWADETDRLVRDAANRIVKDLFRRMSADEEEPTEQLSLPGLHLPTAIAVRRPGEDIYYVASRNATWDELTIGRTERVENIAAAQKRLDLYDRAMIRLRPVMGSNPNITVEEAICLLDELEQAS